MPWRSDGEHNSHAVLSRIEAAALWHAAHEPGRPTYRELGRQFGVGETQAWRIAHGLSWPGVAHAVQDG